MTAPDGMDVGRPGAPGPAVRRPAEWEPHAAVWTAWPTHPDWGSALDAARSEVAALCAVVADGEGAEEVRVLVSSPEARRGAEAALGSAATLVDLPYGDIWLRDIGPIFVRDADGHVAARAFAWNGWGEKYLYPHDAEVNAAICAWLGLAANRRDWVLEGGAIESDGAGTCLTTRQCLSNPNRNPGLSRADVEARLREDLGFQRIVWLDEGLKNDHTDGHIDTLARFVGLNRVVCMHPVPGDPNAAALTTIISALEAEGFDVHTIPSPGAVHGDDGELLPASYVNFYIGNRTVAVPTYGSPHDDEAVAGLAPLFPDRRVVGLSAKAILTGGGAFHCITQEQP